MNVSCVPRVDSLKYYAVEQCNQSHGTQLGKEKIANDMVLIPCTEAKAPMLWIAIGRISAVDVEETDRSEVSELVKKAT